jgi:triosephosphate isomerase
MTQAGKKVLLVANWKSYKTLDEAIAFFKEFPKIHTSHEKIICPPALYVHALADLIKEKRLPFRLGLQDISPFPYGAYTGAISAPMAHNMVDYVIVGHSERRRYFHETNDEIARKAKEVLEVGMTPIICIDEPYMHAQLAFFSQQELKRSVIAYEPLAAIGSGSPDTPLHAQEIASRITQLAEVEMPILYGGSVNADSVCDYVTQPLITGVLVGGASLAVDSWAALVAAA